jgi:glucokinase
LLAFARTKVETSEDVVAGLAAGGLPAALVHAHWRHCPASAKAVDLFVRIAAHEAGSLGIRLLARGGVYISGGVAQRFADALSDGRVAEALVSPPAMRPLRESLPVFLVTHPNPVLMGAVTAACELLGPSD